MNEQSHSQLSLTISAPRDPEARHFQFPHELLVGEAAQEVAKAFGYSPGTPSLQNAQKEVLDRAKSLAASHVHNGDHLTLVDVGGGV